MIHIALANEGPYGSGTGTVLSLRILQIPPSAADSIGAEWVFRSIKDFGPECLPQIRMDSDDT